MHDVTAFYVIFLGYRRDDPTYNRKEDRSAMSTIPDTFVRMFMMSLTEFAVFFEQLEQCDLRTIGKITFLVYMLLVTMLLINMLIVSLWVYGRDWVCLNELMERLHSIRNAYRTILCSTFLGYDDKHVHGGLRQQPGVAATVVGHHNDDGAELRSEDPALLPAMLFEADGGRKAYCACAKTATVGIHFLKLT